ncbi:MAG: sigma 54-interacting transcriptional regulator [Deltaproteobacteria bacterium]|jgi:arginine utilization regulatory protein|nr:sigma 54-interacting transcriptional regulator [Deltaproteobacteria bacterium]
MKKMDWPFHSASRKAVETLFDNHHEGVLIVNASGVMIYYNKVMGILDGLDPEEVVGKHLTEIYNLTHATSVSLRCLASGKPVSDAALYYQARNGNRVNAMCHAYPLMAGREMEGAICYTLEYSSLTESLEKTARNYARHPYGHSLPNEKVSDTGAVHTMASLVGESSVFKAALETAKIGAQTTSSVMICGETGTGKELFAQAIHNNSVRRIKQFCPINCAAIPETLLEGILFGTVKGAFTGAMDRAGLFEVSSGGTIFLDEIHAMPMNLQAKLLRVIQEKKIRRIGGSTEKSVDLKIISSINQKPEMALKNGHLRQDLYFRLAVIFLEIPPLRYRSEDITGLIANFIKICNRKLQGRINSVEPEFIEIMRNYDWPGNVRELEHVIETCMNFAINDPYKRRTLGLAHIQTAHLRRFLSKKAKNLTEADSFSVLEPEIKKNAPDDAVNPLQEELVKLEIGHIRKALQVAGGNRSEAARLLGLTRQNLFHRMKRLKLNQDKALIPSELLTDS